MPAKPILVVDDSPSIRSMIAACLRVGGYEVTEAAAGDEAHQLASNAPQGAPFAMLVTDQVMPGMDGLTLISTLRSDPRYAAIPMLMLTTESDGQIREKARAAGASGFLPKPFDPEQLMQSVDALMTPSTEG